MLNGAISASWGFGLAARCEQLAHEAAMGILDDCVGAYGLTPRLDLQAIHIGETPADAPVILNVKVKNEDEEEKESPVVDASFSLEIDFTWTSSPSSIRLLIYNSIFSKM